MVLFGLSKNRVASLPESAEGLFKEPTVTSIPVEIRQIQSYFKWTVALPQCKVISDKLVFQRINHYQSFFRGAINKILLPYKVY